MFHPWPGRWPADKLALINDHNSWLAKLARLRIDTASGAPHKPLLLLVVLDLAEQRAFGPDVLPLTP